MDQPLSARAATGTWVLLFAATLTAYSPALRGGLLWDDDQHVTATLPAALRVVIWRKRGRIDVRRDALPLLPWLALDAIAGLITASLERFSIGAHGPDFALTFIQQFLLAGRALSFYAASYSGHPT